MSMTVRRLAQDPTLGLTLVGGRKKGDRPSPGPTPSTPRLGSPASVGLHLSCVQLDGSDALVLASNAAELCRRLKL